MADMTTIRQSLTCGQLIDVFGCGLIKELATLHGRFRNAVYLTGGTVRDLLLGRTPVDIDLTVRRDARDWASDLARMTGGTYVHFGHDEDTVRVVRHGRTIDFSSFREGAASIDEDLRRRDITINSMAVPVQGLFDDGSCGQMLSEVAVFDPCSGLDDLAAHCIRITSKQSFQSDPLRMLRVFRFAATLDFFVHRDTLALITRRRAWISRSAPERVTHELNLIMGSERPHRVLTDMAVTGLLFEILPEVRAGVGMAQPASHHLDVFDHCLSTLKAMELVLHDPGRYFPECSGALQDYLAEARCRTQLKWAAFFHDLGKPETMAINEDKGGRITFYNHDQAGSRLFTSIAGRLRWSRDDTAAVAHLIAFHMRPFHLCNVQRRGQLSLKACLRLIRSAGSFVPGLFLLAMSDALAGQGPGRPQQIERELADLFVRLEKVRREHVEPVRSRPPLLTGSDLIAELKLVPSPIFKRILEAVEEAHMEKKISSRREALDLAADVLAQHGEQANVKGKTQGHA